jgi:uncharacterized protein (DUF697 family)
MPVTVEPVDIIIGNHPTDPVTELEAVTAEMQEITASSIVKNHLITSIGLGLVPLPLFDVSALTTVQMNMLRSLSTHYGVSVKDQDLKSMLLSLAGGAMPVLAIVGLSSFAKLIPGIGTLAGSASLSILAGAVTYAVGQTFILHFEAGGTLENFDQKQAQTFFRRELETGKRLVHSIRDEINGSKRRNGLISPQ